MKKRIKYILLFFAAGLLFLIIFFVLSIRITPPEVDNRFDANIKKQTVSANTYIFEDR